MRRGIEKLAYLLSQETDDGLTLLQLGEKHGETVERIMDGLDVLKIVMGQPTQIPPIDWGSDTERRGF